MNTRLKPIANGYPLFFLLVILFNLPAFAAEKIKIKKVKGNTAIIETEAPLKEGQTYEITPEALSEDVDYKANVLKSRQNSLTAGTSFEYIKSDLLQSSSFSLQARYGWNFSTLEVGLLTEISSLDQGGGATTSFLAGGYFDYNLISNRDPRQFIYGVFFVI